MIRTAVVCVMALALSASATAVREAAYKDGAPKIRIEINERGRAHGAYVAYHRNGMLRTRGTYAEGKRVGLWVHVDERGFICGYEDIIQSGNVHAIRMR